MKLDRVVEQFQPHGLCQTNVGTDNEAETVRQPQEPVILKLSSCTCHGLAKGTASSIALREQDLFETRSISSVLVDEFKGLPSWSKVEQGVK